MIAASNDPGANQDGETGENMFTECCQLLGDDEEDCETWSRLEFPSRNCDFLGMERTDFGVAVIVNWTATKQNIHLIASSFAGKDAMDICDGTALRVKRALGP